MAAHRYWRLTNLTVGSVWLLLSELSLFIGSGVERVKTPASGMSAQTAPGGGGDFTSKMQDDVYTGESSWSKATAENASFWIKWDFGSGGDVDVTHFQQACGSIADQHIHQCDVEWSDDDSAWTSVGTINLISGLAVSTLGLLHDIGADQPEYIVRYPVGFLTRVLKDPRKNVDITSTGTHAMAKGFFHAVDVTVNGTLELLRSYTKILAFASTATVDTIKRMYKTFSSTTSGSVQLARDYTRIIGITVTGTPLMLRKIAMTFAIAASGAATAAVQKGINVAVAVSSAVIVALQKVGFIQGDPDDTAVMGGRPTHAEMPKRDDEVMF